MERFAQRLAHGLALASGLALLAVTAIMVVDATGRYFLGRPLTSAVELVELLMGLALCFGLALTTLARGHIRVDLLTQLAPRPLRRALDRLSDAASLAFLALVAVIGLRLGWLAASLTETDVIERYAAAYLAEAGAGAALSNCHAETAQGHWVKLRVICRHPDGREWRFGAGLWGRLPVCCTRPNWPHRMLSSRFWIRPSALLRR